MSNVTACDSATEPSPEPDDATLWAAFVDRSLPVAAWTHRAHLRVAWLHLARWPALDEAHLRMRVGIVRLNQAHGLDETATRGYHETLTRVWLTLVAGARAIDPCASSDRFLARHPELLDRDAPLRHYRRERLFSLEARAVMVPPDRAPLPSPVDDPVTTRPARRDDEPFLWRALAWAAHMPGDGSDDDVAAARREDGLIRYVAGFGDGADAGVIAEVGGTPVGAAWIRTIRAYGFVREGVPELAIGVAPAWRGRGLGERMLAALLPGALAAHEAISLSVRRDNPAVRLYERAGFAVVEGSEVVNRVGGVSITMVLARGASRYGLNH